MEELYKISHQLLLEHIKLKRLLWHSYAADVVLEGIAVYLGQNIIKWKIAGLLHDLDIEITKANINVHTKETEKILLNNNFPIDIIEAIKMHNEIAQGKKRSKLFHHALAAGETLSGFIAFTVAVKNESKIENVSPSSILNLFNDKDFHPKFDRKTILECEMIGIPLFKFIEIGVESMKKISNKIGL